MSKFNAVSCCFGQIPISILTLFLQPLLEVVICLWHPSSSRARERLCLALPSGNLAPGPALARGGGPPAPPQPAPPCRAAVFLLASWKQRTPRSLARSPERRWGPGAAALLGLAGWLRCQSCAHGRADPAANYRSRCPRRRRWGLVCTHERRSLPSLQDPGGGCRRSAL